jgi:hypothetical protein
VILNRKLIIILPIIFIKNITFSGNNHEDFSLIYTKHLHEISDKDTARSEDATFYLAAFRGEISKRKMSDLLINDALDSDQRRYLYLGFRNNYASDFESILPYLSKKEDKKGIYFGLELLLLLEPSKEMSSWLGQNIYLAYTCHSGEQENQIQAAYIRALASFFTQATAKDYDVLLRKVLSQPFLHSDVRQAMITGLIGASSNAEQKEMREPCKEIVEKCIMEEFEISLLEHYFAILPTDFANELLRKKRNQLELIKAGITQEKINSRKVLIGEWEKKLELRSEPGA